ncbi:MAG: DUF3168 domain-containing protein [Alphaproteobacteria bacterium]|nr:DUF3168 domain-containing protein [Alphaproteobacteria bacterium]MDE2014189.1 DUF3168 domain-containing protein [Alphaproteobacteria bacterium]
MSEASWALQQAIYAELCASVDVKSVLGDPPRIYDAVPRAALFPYAVIGDGQENDWSTATESGSEHILMIQVWSRGQGHREAKQLAETIRAALDGGALAVSGQSLIDIRFTSAEYARQPDGETWAARLKFRAVMEPAP